MKISNSLLAKRKRLFAVANGASINGTYKMFPIEALEAFKQDIKDVLEASK